MKDEWEWVGRFRVPVKANQYSDNWTEAYSQTLAMNDVTVNDNNENE